LRASGSVVGDRDGAERTPEARGVNMTIIVQAELTAMAELHVGFEEL